MVRHGVLLPAICLAVLLTFANEVVFVGLHPLSAGPRCGNVPAKATATLEKEDQEILEKLKSWESQQVADEAALLAGSDFPIKPEEVLKKAKIFLAYDQGVSKPEL